MELCSPVTDRQTDTQAINGTTDFREYRQSWSCACLWQTDRQTSTQAINGRNNRLKRIHRVMGLCMPVTDRQTDRHTGNQWNNGLERVQKVTELVSPVTDRHIHTDLENPDSHRAVLAVTDRQIDRHTGNQWKEQQTWENPGSHGAELICDRQTDKQTHRQTASKQFT